MTPLKVPAWVTTLARAYHHVRAWPRSAVSALGPTSATGPICVTEVYGRCAMRFAAARLSRRPFNTPTGALFTAHTTASTCQPAKLTPSTTSALGTGFATAYASNFCSAALATYGSAFSSVMELKSRSSWDGEIPSAPSRYVMMLVAARLSRRTLLSRVSKVVPG